MTITICTVQHCIAGAIYVGRRMPRYQSRQPLDAAILRDIHSGSALCNPFRPGKVPDPIGHFRRYLWDKIQAGDQLIRVELDRIVDQVFIAPVTLACWCAKEPRVRYTDPEEHIDGCHADVIANAVMWLAYQRLPEGEVPA